MKKYRIEHDSIGDIKVDDSKLWGAQTQRSLENFVIGNETMPLDLIKAIALIKGCCALANLKFKKIDSEIAKTIALVADEINNNKFNDQFPLKIWQTGSGTQTNMNVNEVIAHRATNLLKNKPVHPNDHVNMSQSSNDVFPTAIHISIAQNIVNKLIPSIEFIMQTLKELENKYKDVIKIGRTHLQDATPITLGQEISGWRESINTCLLQIKDALKHLYELPLGGTAVGTGLNASTQLSNEAIKLLANKYKLPFISLKNKFNGLAFKERVASVHGQLKVLATTLYKIANDVRFLGSGPRAGIGELILPANEPGSSIMPGKVNPTQSEAIMMVTTQVMANDVAISFAASQGNFELNTFMPLIAFDSLWSIQLLTDAIDSFTKKCLKGITINNDKIKYNLEHSLMLVTALSPKIGYAKAAEIAKLAHKENLTLKQAVLKLNYISEKDFDKLVDPKKMI